MGDPADVLTEKINDGIFGINAALWDGDLPKPATAQYVKEVNHAVLRYPGGLRADDDHWEEILNKKDWMTDAVEFLDFCKQTNTTPMFTVNFGSGTPEEAAKWVKHVNVDLKANVKYWEVGNELYGDWHPFHCTGEEYGKRAAEFIKAMKAVDPTIKVTTVWVLEGTWNRDVFKYTKEIADGVNVHHYPQHAGEENDAGLLAAPNSLNGIIPGVRKQLEEYGVPGKKYEIWLTEWNSVDFKPGPQTLGIINALFVADYLGKLAEHNIDQASYWDIHNDITEQGGDYGYLSRTGAPDGDNIPRPSYWAFKLASESLRGKLLKSSSGNEDVTSYLTEKDGKKTLMIINKKPETKAVITLSIPGFTGNAVIKQLKKDNMKAGYSKENVTISNNHVITVPAYSVTSISLQ
jgi:alpha-L-arabinofuranosidase